MRCNSQNLLGSHLTVICQSHGEGLGFVSPDHPQFSAAVQLERIEKEGKKCQNKYPGKEFEIEA